MWNSNSVKNSIVSGTMLSREGGENVESNLHKKLVDSLIYLTATPRYDVRIVFDLTLYG